MKKLLFTLAILPLFIASSCSSNDEDSKKEIESSFVGIWEETCYWSREGWHTWGFLEHPIWEIKSDNTYYIYESEKDYKAGKSESNGTWRATDKYFITGENYVREYFLSSDKSTIQIKLGPILVRK